MKIKTALLIALLSVSACSKPYHPPHFAKGDPKPNEFWWPNKIDLSPLRANSVESNPYGENFNYGEEFKKVDIKQLKKDIEKVMKDSQDWWPADYGNYGPFFIRMAWHSAGTYRTFDGRGGAGGGQQRFEPLNSWPDNANLDKARRLLWPVKQKYGKSVSWADLMVLAGNVALESMGFETIGFAGGRVDDFEPELVYWGPENEFLAANRREENRPPMPHHPHPKFHGKKGELERPLGATQMGLIYVNPEGPNGEPDPLKAAHAIREAFSRMAMNDEETVALIAGGHTFGKTHGAHDPKKCIGADPAASPLEAQGMGWKNKCGSGKGIDATTSGLEGSWTTSPTVWTHQYLTNLYKYDWKKTKSPAGATQWIPTDESAYKLAPDAHDPSKRHSPIMFTTDLALKFDPAYNKISKRFLDNPKEFEKAFARAWFKLTHRDMGPSARYVGKEFPKQQFLWQDPIPEFKYQKINAREIAALKTKILRSGLTIPELVKTAFASASTYRNTDMRGGANGARIALEPQINWPVNNPEELKKVLAKLKEVQTSFNKELPANKKVSLADIIVLGGSAAVEKAARNAGVYVKVDFSPGRSDASQDQTDIDSFNNLEPKADGFRNYYSQESFLPPIKAMIDKANMLDLSVPEMTVLVGGLRTLGANYDNSNQGIFTDNKNKLSNDFFVNLLDMSIKWEKSDQKGVFNGVDRKTNKVKFTASPIDLMFGSSSELRAISEVYASKDGQKKFVQDFVKTWVKVMRNDRFDLKK